MKPTLNEKFLAYLALISGLTLSMVAEYYSILGLTAIFSAAFIPVVIMGIALGVGKVTATLWLKQNWKIAPLSIKAYLFTAIAVLMFITSMGIFGFLSKAHSDQNLVSGDVQSKIAVYDEKIKTARENIDANRKALKQMDEAVDQVMARSQDEKGADKAVAIRRGQARERTRLLAEIQAEQKTIIQLNEERAPIAAEVRKVEAEVGPIKYIAAFVYGETDQTVLEKAVTWVIIILIVVFDPLAVILLLASQISFQDFRERGAKKDIKVEEDFSSTEEFVKAFAIAPGAAPALHPDLMAASDKPDARVADVGEKPTAKEKDGFLPTYEEIKSKSTESEISKKESDVASTATVTEPAPHHLDGWVVPSQVVTVEPKKSEVPSVSGKEMAMLFPDLNESEEVKTPVRTVITGNRSRPRTKIFRPPQTLTTVTEQIVQEQLEQNFKHEVTHMGNGYVQVDGQLYHEGAIPTHIQGYIQNEEQRESGVWSQVKKNEE